MCEHNYEKLDFAVSMSRHNRVECYEIWGRDELNCMECLFGTVNFFVFVLVKFFLAKIKSIR